MKLSAQEKCKLAGLLARHRTPAPDGVGARPRHALPGLPEGFVREKFPGFLSFCFLGVVPKGCQMLTHLPLNMKTGGRDGLPCGQPLPRWNRGISFNRIGRS